MNIKVTLLSALLIVSLFPARSYSSITYKVTPRAGDSAHWALLGGSITTDGTIGEISILNFERWEMRFSSPAGVSKISSNDGGALLTVESLTLFDSIHGNCCQQPINATMTATANELLLNPGFLSFLNLTFTNQDVSSNEFTEKSVTFSPRSHNLGLGFGGSIVDNAVDSSNPYHPYEINATLIPGGKRNLNRAMLFSPLGSLAIGTVSSIPEPSSVLLLGVVCLTLQFRNRMSMTVQ